MRDGTPDNAKKVQLFSIFMLLRAGKRLTSACCYAILYDCISIGKMRYYGRHPAPFGEFSSGRLGRGRYAFFRFLGR
ncbi:MAG: hypothetical protein MR400_11205, partial [Clostridiales bacterium]|nr:hypothetical protein [Clostridiales bacterium]